MAFKQRLEHHQKQVFSQGLRQTVKILELPVLDLKEMIDAEIVDNPAVEETREPLEPRLLPRETSRDAAPETPEDPYRETETGTSPEEQSPYERPVPGKKESLTDALLRQLRINAENEIQLEIGGILILYIDDNGYLREDAFSDEELSGQPADEIEKAIRLLQTFEPAGVGARNLKECLLLQLNRYKENAGLTIRLIEEHLEDLASPDTARLCKKCKCTPEELSEALKKIHALEPKPGRSFSSEEIAYVIPDISVEEKDGALTVTVEEGALPTIRVNPTYRAMLRSRTVDEKTKEFIREKIKNAGNLIHAIQSRRETLAKVVELIVEFQKEAIEEGMEKLKPLTCKEMAQKSGLHESTISRIIAKKYVQTPLGVFALKDFFSTGLKTSNGEDVSSQRIKLKIQELIDQEDKANPLRDQAIAELISQAENIVLARRTIAKYRETIGIPPVSQRRTR